jgi:hypothetical protein
MSLPVQLLLVLPLWSSCVFAAEPSPTGLWRTIDDSTGKPRGLVRITEVNGQYQGRLERRFRSLVKIPIRSAISAAVRARISR